ncbi:NINE protein [Senegalimassilia anaerobia]
MDSMNERSAADELAAAEAELKAAQERLDAARQRMASGQPQQPASYASQPATAWQPDAPAQGQPYMPQAGAQQPAQPYAAPQGSAYTQPQAQVAQQPYGAQPGYGSVPPQNPYGQQAQYGYQQPYVAPTVGEKDHVAAGLLALFLGWLGVHKFYLGYNTSGFIMLGTSILGGILTLSVASWAIWVIAIVEGIFYLSKSQTEFEQMYVINKREWF